MLPYFIGYGGLAPSTWTGRVFCMIYALVGIPFCLVFISALGRQIFNASQRLCIKSSCCRHRKWLPLLIYILLGSVLFIWMAAAMFGSVEDWAYRDAVYYAFITLSTIGFGDFIPGRWCDQYKHRFRMERNTTCFVEAFFSLKDVCSNPQFRQQSNQK